MKPLAALGPAVTTAAMLVLLELPVRAASPSSPTASTSAKELADPGAGSVDKRQFHLFHRTPRELLRELSPDRPDTTESPITVDAGWCQIESSLFDYGRSSTGGTQEEVFTYGSINFKIGLRHNVDVQFVFDVHTEVRTTDRAAGVTETVEGFSDVQMRLKVNLWGNDGGRTALALFPFIKIPTGSALSNDRVEGGLMIPFSVELNDRLGLALMAQVDVVYDEERRSYGAEFVHTAVLGIGLTERLGAYLEYVGVAGSHAFDYQATASAGLTYGISDDVLLDVGGRLGMNDAAEDCGIFAGLAVRF